MRGRAARLGSVYIGGGTPSLMSADQVARLLAAADGAFGIADRRRDHARGQPRRGRPWRHRRLRRGRRQPRLDRRPEPGRRASCSTLGRRHSATDVADHGRMPRAQPACRSVSVDLLYDVPGQTIASWRDSLDVTLALEPDHVSAYSLTLDEQRADRRPPRAQPVGPRSGAREPGDEQDDDRAAEMYELLDDGSRAPACAWYEISNWSRAGPREPPQQRLLAKRSRGRRSGPGAHASTDDSRVAGTLANLERYSPRSTSDRLPPGDSRRRATPTSGRRTRDPAPAHRAQACPTAEARQPAVSVGRLVGARPTDCSKTATRKKASGSLGADAFFQTRSSVGCCQPAADRRLGRTPYMGRSRVPLSSSPRVRLGGHARVAVVAVRRRRPCVDVVIHW